MRERRWWCVPATVFCAADGFITLCGHPPAYWSGDFSQVREGNPLAAWLLTVHPLAFAAAGVPYLLVVVGAILTAPRRWAAGVAIGVAVAHAFAVSLWCQALFREPLLPSAAVGLVLLALAALTLWRGRERAGPGATPDRGRPAFRFLGAAVLAALAYPLSLGPACWALSWLQLEGVPEVSHTVSWAYSPLGPAVVAGPGPVRRGLKWWMWVGMPPRTEFHDDRSKGVGWSNPGYTFTLWHY
jgi:hypothetical protein